MNIFSQKQVEMLLDEVLRFHIGTLFLDQSSKCMFPAAQEFSFSPTMRYYFTYKGSQYRTPF